MDLEGKDADEVAPLLSQLVGDNMEYQGCACVWGEGKDADEVAPLLSQLVGDNMEYQGCVCAWGRA
jgi:hypothetical protein